MALKPCIIVYVIYIWLCWWKRWYIDRYLVVWKKLKNSTEIYHELEDLCVARVLVGILRCDIVVPYYSLCPRSTTETMKQKRRGKIILNRTYLYRTYYSFTRTLTLLFFNLKTTFGVFLERDASVRTIKTNDASMRSWQRLKNMCNIVAVLSLICNLVAWPVLLPFYEHELY